MVDEWTNRGKLIILSPSDVTETPNVGEPPLALLLDRVVPGLMRSTYTFNRDTDITYNNITADSLVATNYIEPGVPGATSNNLSSPTITVDLGNDRAEFDAADLVYTSIGNATNDTFTQIVITREQDASITEANTFILAQVGVASTLTNGGNITLVWNAEGILQLTT